MSRHASDRGAVLIHVAIVLTGLFLFSAFVVDYGTFWVARGQAQNAADAGALAGAIARLYDDPTSPPASTTTGKVPESVFSATAKNYIWGVSPPSNTVSISYSCPDGTTNCVAVDVFRDGTNNSTALPTFFLKMVNINSQGTKAHAVAKAVSANGTGCLRPWFMADPGYTTPDDFGNTATFRNDGSPSGYFQLDVSGKGGAGIRDAIEHCATVNNGNVVAINDLADANTEPGGTEGPEAQGIEQLIQWDECQGGSPCSDATVTVSGTGVSRTARVTGGCADSATGCVCSDGKGGSTVCPLGPRISPRVVTVALCDPAQVSCSSGGAQNKNIAITNFLSFFIVGCNGVVNACSQTGGGNVNIDAILIDTAGLSVARGGSPNGNESFVQAVVLIR